MHKHVHYHLFVSSTQTQARFGLIPYNSTWWVVAWAFLEPPVLFSRVQTPKVHLYVTEQKLKISEWEKPEDTREWLFGLPACVFNIKAAEVLDPTFVPKLGQWQIIEFGEGILKEKSGLHFSPRTWRLAQLSEQKCEWSRPANNQQENLAKFLETKTKEIFAAARRGPTQLLELTADFSPKLFVLE